MNLVDEENDLASGFLDLFHDGLEAFLELAAELGSGEHCAQVEGHDAPVFEAVGDVVGDDALGKGFGDGGLADAGLANHDGVVLAAAGEGLHEAANFVFAAYDGVELAFAGEGGEVDAVAFEGAVLGFGPRVGDSAGAANLHEGLVHLFLVDAVGLENGGGFALLLQCGGNQDVLGADVFVVEAFGFQAGVVHQSSHPWGAVYLCALRCHLGGTFQGPCELVAQRISRDSHLAENLHGQAVFDLEQGQQDVLHVPLAVAVLPYQFLGTGDGLLGLFGEFFGSE